MLRLVGGAVTNVIVWVIVVSLVNLAVRHGWPAYAAVEKAMTFTLPMMVARLSMSAVSSLAGGAVARTIDRSRSAPLVGGIILLLVFLPEHYALWPRFPVWYHLTFLTSLPVLGWAGGRIARHAPA
jgi:hypothetical protein